jgi:hypothetical protein
MYALIGYLAASSDAFQPDDHISIFSLRNWGKMRGNVLTTEQVC